MNSASNLQNLPSILLKEQTDFLNNYVCHHNKSRKSKSGVRKSKNLNCEASISIVKEKYDCNPFSAKITIHNKHSHPINSAQSLSWLPGSAKTRATYEEYFSNGMGITEAINFHVTKIKMENDQVELADASINPKYRTVRHWHDVWRQKQLGMGVSEKPRGKQAEYEKSGQSAESSYSTEGPRSIATDTPLRGIDPSCSTEKSLTLTQNWTQVSKVLRSKIEKFGCNPLILKQWLQCLQKVNSRNALETCMASFGSSVQVKQHRRAAIHVQRTAISRRKVGVTQGSKQRPGGCPAVGEPKRKKNRNSVKQLTEFETDDAFLESSNVDSDENDDSDCETNPKCEDFIETSYEKLWDQMSPVEDGTLVRKVIIKEGFGENIQDDSVIKVHYIGYCEHSKEPIAFTDENDSELIDMKDGKHLVGLLMALKSMKIGETARFLLSHKVMYGQYGCPPLIPPKAMCLFTMSISNIVPITESNADKGENQTTFQKVYKVARDVYVRGVFLYKKTEYSHAVKAFTNSVRLLEFCRLADQTEEDKHQKFLTKLYTNLAICYLKLNLPLKACCMCNELNYLGKLWNNSKALLQSARALSLLGEYVKAEKRIKTALSMDPESDELKNELQNIQNKRALADKNSRILESSTEFSLQLKESNPQDNTTATSPSATEFANSAEHFCKFFVENKELCKTSLPRGLTKSESEIIMDLVKKYNLFCQCENDIVVSISKMEINNTVDVIGEEDKDNPL